MKGLSRFHRQIALLTLLLLPVLLVGCGTLEVGVETETPLPDPTPTDGPPAATAVPEPTATPTPTQEPPGLRVAFINDNYVWLWSEGEEMVPLASAGEPAGLPAVRISDDGAIVAFLRAGELWVVNSDGTGERLLVGNDDMAAMERRSDYQDAAVALQQFDWIPGTHLIAFNTRIQVRIQVPVLNDDLYVVDADTLEQTLSLPPGEGGNFVYSPDGSRAAIIRPGSIDLIDQDGGNRREVFTHTPVMIAPNAGYYVEPVWAADSSVLRVAVPPVDPSAPSSLTTIWHIPTNGTPATLLGSIMVLPEALYQAFSPDLNRVAYLGESGNLQPELLVTQLDSGETTVYYDAVTGLAGWSADSQHLAFETQDLGAGLPPQSQVGQLGSDPISVYETDQAVLGLTWVDETRYIFLVGTPGGWDVFLGEVGEQAMFVVSVNEPFPLSMTALDFSH